jgi:acetate kinase
MDEKAYLYAIPYEYYLDHKIRRYGFHGTSHKYVVNRTAEMLGKRVEDLKVIVCHLGNGASVCAIDKGRSVDTSMGLTPLEGLVMGTRSGDLDPAVVELIAKKEELSLDDVMHVLNKESGVKGLSGLSSDFRDLEEGLELGSKNARRALDVYIHRVIKYIGSYAAVMNGVDALVFTAGVGENDPYVRERITRSLSYLGIEVDRILNECRGVERRITKVGATTETFVIPTNEELMMSREAIQILESANGN